MEHSPQAAGYWVSLGDVADKLNPVEGSSKLSKYCTLLRTFGEHGREGIVSLCVVASHNFIAEFNEGNIDNVLNVRNSPGRSDLYGTPFAVHGWDRNQYHGGVVLTLRDCEEGRKACYAFRPSSQSRRVSTTPP